MSKAHIETLESRQHLSITHLLPDLGLVGTTKPGASVAATARPTTQAARTLAVQPAATSPSEYNLNAAQVRQILAQAASQTRPGQAVAIVDREGIVLGVYATTTATAATIDAAIARARTGAYFQSTQNAFTTRTARFIIQDHFPHPVRNTAGGPLYGVEFSSLPGTDMLPATQTPGVSGDPGGMPLFINKVPAGGIGVAGDGRDTAARKEFVTGNQKFYNGREEADFDESVAIAGSVGTRTPDTVRINASAPEGIRATKVFLPGPALRFPYTVSKPASANPFRTLDELVAAGLGTITSPIVASQPNPFPKVDASVYGISGELKNTSTLNNSDSLGVIESDDTAATRLTVADVNQIISQAVATSTKVRAAIRLPVGVPAKVHIAVVDRDGTVLGVFRETDGTNFSFDVAVQKARTAAFFSDDTHAFSTRSIGFMSQAIFPAGVNSGGTDGPLFHLQNALSTEPGNLGRGPLANGITVFPGGVPLYKDGVFVGAIGISGDGVEQDDEIAFGGAANFQPAVSIRSDSLNPRQISTHIVARVQAMQAIYDLDTGNPNTGTIKGYPDFATQARTQFNAKFDFRLPYVKFARNSRI